MGEITYYVLIFKLLIRDSINNKKIVSKFYIVNLENHFWIHVWNFEEKLFYVILTNEVAFCYNSFCNYYKRI